MNNTIQTDGEIDIRLFYQVTDKLDYPPSYFYNIYLHNTPFLIGSIAVHQTCIPGKESYGEIEYQIEEEYRGNHYAEKAFRLLIPQLKSLEKTSTIITCDINNIASKKTIENLGGVLIRKIKDEYNNEKYLYEVPIERRKIK